MLKPLAILLNGLTVYQPSPFTPLDPLASKLRDAGFDTCVTNHFNFGCDNTRAPTIIIGHSQGGASAIELAQRYPSALVMTFDAVRASNCPGTCINFQTANYRAINVRGAQNLPVNGNHVMFVLDPFLQNMVVNYAKTNARRNVGVDLSKRDSQPRIRTKLGGILFTRPEPAQRITEQIPEFTSTTEYWFDRWPNDSFGELNLSIEQLCEALLEPPQDVCPETTGAR